MKKYGLRIGDVGIEFTSVDERDKALRDFTKGVDVNISSEGVRFSDGTGSFSVYDRDTKEVLINCELCKGVFGIDTCSKRHYQILDYTWSKEFTDHEGYICDACLAAQDRAKKVFDAKKIIQSEE